MITPFICARPQRAQNGMFCFIGREACTGAFLLLLRAAATGRARAGGRTGTPARGAGAARGLTEALTRLRAPTGISRVWISCPVIVYMHYGCDIMHS